MTRGASTPALLALLAAVALTCAAPAAAQSAVQAVLYAAPGGSGDQCSRAQPCSLLGAQLKVRTLNKAMTGHILVRLLGGTYTVSRPFTIWPGDSGTGGHKVVYEAAPGEAPVLSGGQRITGWTWNAAGGVWVARVPEEFRTRQLFVNGQRAVRARGPGNPAGWERRSYGFEAPDTRLSRWAHGQPRHELADVELVGNNGWRHFRCPVASAVDGDGDGRDDVVLQQPCWDNSRRLSPYFDQVARVENAGYLRDEPGEWFLDRRPDGANWLSYRPRPTDPPGVAPTVIAPVHQTLFDLAGTPQAPVRDVIVRGLRFVNTTWLGPDDPGGYVEQQAGWHLKVPPPAYRYERIPGAVRLGMVRGVTIERNTFARLGGTGLSVEAGSQGVAIRDNRFDDSSATAIQIGEVAYADRFATPERRVRAISVLRNRVTRVGRDYPSTIGILAGYVSDLVIDHNELSDLPYTGISVGWGWGVPNDTRNVRITGNRIQRVVQTLSDGGGIYVMGVKAAPPTPVISENYVTGVPHPQGGLYLDNASIHWQVTRNVVGQVGRYWLHMSASLPPAVGNTATGNWSDTSAMWYPPDASPPNVVTGNQMDLRNWPPEAQAVIDRSGLGGPSSAARSNRAGSIKDGARGAAYTRRHAGGDQAQPPGAGAGGTRVHPGPPGR